jgi:hypothetical protein
MAPVLAGTDALFEERTGMSRSDALRQHPTGGKIEHDRVDLRPLIR